MISLCASTKKVQEKRRESETDEMKRMETDFFRLESKGIMSHAFNSHTEQKMV